MKITEIFTSVKGEGLYIGLPMTFIRFAGCNLSCEGCDTQRASKGIKVPIEDIIGRVCEDRTVHVVITGGEPMLQNSLDVLLEQLKRRQKHIHLETNGTIESPLYKEFDWIACSPKSVCGTFFEQDRHPGLVYADEVKIIHHDFHYFADSEGGPRWRTDKTQYLYVQPWANKQFINQVAVNEALEIVHRFPQWRYSTQLHKTLGVM